ncbi:MAG: alpha-hydroxy-acid oxidizing protein [Proteobacteria bacterium]|nr:alpha-hydroxy-acid oxidizing protein [Pseudomonadota bacterium]
MKLSACHNIEDLRTLAQKKLPAPMFHYIDGGADDEVSLRGATRAFDDYELMPRYLVDVDTVDMRTKVLGQELAWPVFCSPTGMSRLFHHDKELAVVRGAEKFGTMYSLSTLGTTSIEDVAKASKTPKMFQIYVHKDRGLTAEFVQRCKDAGFAAICLTVDAPVAGNRERDFRTGMIMPPRFGLKGILNFLYHFEWTFNIVRNPDFRLANVVHRVDALGKGTMSLIQYVNSQLSRSVTWDDAAWLIKEWGGPFAIKGLQSADDARRARDIGASAVMISNHGGRQLDSAPAPVHCIAAMREAVGDDLELILDGGIRRGTHVLKALALGANACSVGRGYLYGLAAGGQPGVERALALLHKEVERAMRLTGCSKIADITPERLSKLPLQRPSERAEAV